MKEYKVVIEDNGNICWYKPGTDILHREDGPAIECSNGNKFWYQNNLLHRVGGPALDYTNDRRRKQYFLNDKLYSEQEYNQVIECMLFCANQVLNINGKKYKLTEID